MIQKPNRIDALVADLACVRDDELVDEVRSPRATTLLATIIETPVDARELADARTRRGRAGRSRVRLLVLAAALASAVGLSTAALGVVREAASFFAGWRDPDAPVPKAPDVVIASGEAGVPWRIVATTSNQGLCLGLVYRVRGESAGNAGCGRTDVRGDPWADDTPRHWIGAFGAGGGGSNVLNRTFAFGPLAEDVASVELVLSDGQTVRAHVVERPDGLDAPFSFYWAAWPCGSSRCVDAAGPLVRMAIARDSTGRLLERRFASWHGNPTGDPDGPPPPS